MMQYQFMTEKKKFGLTSEVETWQNEESGTDIFGPGYQHWGKDAEAYLKDTKYAGKKFKDMVVLYYTSKLYEDVVDEIEFDMEQQKKVLNQRIEIKAEIGG